MIKKIMMKKNHFAEECFFNCYSAAPWPRLGHDQSGSLTNLMLITALLHILPEGHSEPQNEIGSLSLDEHLVGFEPETILITML